MIFSLSFIQAIHKAAVYENKRYLQYLVSAHRFAGITVEVLGQGKVKICYETCYKGAYLCICIYVGYMI